MVKHFNKLTTICFLLVLLSGTETFSQIPVFQWVHNYGSTFAEDGQSVAVDATGNVFAVGAFRNTIDFDPGPATMALTSSGVTDVYITKIDANGNNLWAKQIGNGFAEYVNDIAIDPSGNLLITGAFQSSVDFDPGPSTSVLVASGIDVFVLKLDNNGNFLWARNMGGTSTDQGISITTTSAGEVITVGEFNGTADFNPGPSIANLTSFGGADIFVSKLDASGNFVWANGFGGTGTDAGLGITTNSLGVFFTGYFQGIADFDPSVATYTLNSSGSNDVFLCRLNHSGTFNFAVNIGGTGADIANSITTDNNSAILITGQFNGSADFDPTVATNTLVSSGSSDIFVAKYTNNGNLTWARKMGGSFADYGNSIAVDNLNNIYSTGTFKDAADFDPSLATFSITSNSGTDDIYIHKLDANGNFIWVKYFGGNSADEPHAIALDNTGNIYTTGNFQTTVDFNPDAGVDNKTAIGGTDAFVHKMGVCVPPVTPTNTTPNSNLTICVGQTASLSVSGTGLLTWYPTANSTSSLAIGNSYITPTLTAGTYSYYVEASTCTTSVNRTLITLTVSVCSGLVEKAGPNTYFKIYPNPSNGIYTIDAIADIQIILRDIMGKQILQQTISDGKHQIDISKYEKGIYFLELKSNSALITTRLIKE
ncbi:MAG: SBBP repeat-containing protein [Bacteroidia bacterium]|nr:SBBP repeat-containing protein [Bacteroidia bacterium]